MDGFSNHINQACLNHVLETMKCHYKNSLYNTPSRLHRARETISTHKYNSVKLLLFWFFLVFPIIII